MVVGLLLLLLFKDFEISKNGVFFSLKSLFFDFFFLQIKV